MLIYLVNNVWPGKVTIVCDSFETMNSVSQNTQSLCIVGTKEDADRILANNQQDWLTNQSSLFTVNLQIDVEDGVRWVLVNLNTEPKNTDRKYFIIDPTTGLHTEAIGLTSAQEILKQIKQKYLKYTRMDSYETFTSWPKYIK